MGVTIGATWRIRLVDMCGGDDEACCHHRPITVATCCYFVPDRDAKYCALYVCMYVCMSVCALISKTTYVNVTNFAVCVLLWPWFGPLLTTI